MDNEEQLTSKEQEKTPEMEPDSNVLANPSASAGEANSEIATALEEPRNDNEDSEKGRWYVVHTYSGHEAKVAATLKQKIKAQGMEKRIFEILVPTQEKIEVREGKKVTINEKIFPGYILVRMDLDDETWYTVRSTAGVTSFVGIGNKPTPLDAKEVKTIQRFMRMEAPTYKASFSLDEPVKIIDGPFAEFLGTVEQIDEAKGKVKVLVSIFGRETPVELDFLQVSKL